MLSRLKIMRRRREILALARVCKTKAKCTLLPTRMTMQLLPLSHSLSSYLFRKSLLCHEEETENGRVRHGRAPFKSFFGRIYRPRPPLWIPRSLSHSIESIQSSRSLCLCPPLRPPHTDCPPKWLVCGSLSLLSI